ncbi:BolA family protein [Shewanella fodinae]|jgi:BolA protein|uniref:DNA-binding transcriptional regulator BolA n=1 Tax=Shewanella fodinae TaxID=552357 RepID=A0A4R2F222_9GAMM|nr:BolA/IbaG family iron-sulfur metabolism protein [Shewanella fodinae]MCD8476353.1 BolA/IbaG family iron-sulfur metabolism protein [Shewanella fodinae]MCL2908079.1 BolA/IbaG family iron-sulfur metabolism protein [Shewanella fodinae]TCN78053.1 BolA protein family transcriptional regulator [Shewanella fodinae]GGZ01066.1 global transcriptional regulator BolA [Shewanella fodinae]
MSVAETIQQKLQAALLPEHIEVLNESHNHHVPPNSETHFKVVLVSQAFNGLRLLARHRKVNETLAHELANGVHALSMHTYTPEEWLALAEVPQSPKCRG